MSGDSELGGHTYQQAQAIYACASIRNPIAWRSSS